MSKAWSEAQFEKAVEIVQASKVPNNPKSSLTPLGSTESTQGWTTQAHAGPAIGATVGDVNIARPGMLDFVGKAKWDAWKRAEGTAPEVARNEYVTLLVGILDSAEDEDMKKWRAEIEIAFDRRHAGNGEYLLLQANSSTRLRKASSQLHRKNSEQSDDRVSGLRQFGEFEAEGLWQLIDGNPHIGRMNYMPETAFLPCLGTEAQVWPQPPPCRLGQWALPDGCAYQSRRFLLNCTARAIAVNNSGDEALSRGEFQLLPCPTNRVLDARDTGCLIRRMPSSYILNTSRFTTQQTALNFHLPGPPPHFYMPAGRRTRSGRAAPVAPMKRIRTKGGCLTCRIRRKKCDESREFANGGCETCSRLHIECLGYSTKRPDWLKGSRVDDYKRRIKHFLADHNAKSSARGQDDAFLHLHHLRESSSPPRQHSESAHSDSDSDSVYVEVKQQVSSPLFVQVPLPPQSMLFSLHRRQELNFASALDSSAWDWSMGVSPAESCYGWPGPPQFDCDTYGEDAGGSPICEYSSYGMMPVAVSMDPLPTLSDNTPSGYEYDLLSTDFNPPMPDLLDSPIQVMMSPYVFPTADPGAAAQSSAVWSSFLETLRLSQLETALGYDPEGAAAVSKALDLESSLTPTELSPEKQAELTDHRQRAMYCLLKSGYNKEEARAVTSLWMMAGSLRQGHFECWGNCLDIILGWAHKRLSAISSRPGPFAISTLEDTERVVLGRGLWSDLIASITTRQIPLHIDLYRTVLPAADYDILDCPNNVALAFAEIVTLAANSSHIPQARGKLNALRKDLEHSSAKPTAQIHTAGVRLYLEIVASRGMADSAPVQKAVEALCKLILETDSLRRDFAFWIFLAGCHATDQGQWHGCRLMMNELIDAEEEKDIALKVASDIMDQTHDARKRRDVTAHTLWIDQMLKRGVLLA
ncbi:Lysine biosynthesis regulatory protein LYS14 [Ceratobasidium theobromae]|uniref:Lysine biosynthesis regulatory protein LYS14 n=1 Tax=Ceratobasidium theobromae TaxID=1582974 RepID=A0A5N5QWM3_9AGAM|nr:Lysine biosynthesis regulatory protein LYS14 [Ceratobasidium theobromae]